jgi:glutamate 5-kinase
VKAGKEVIIVTSGAIGVGKQVHRHVAKVQPKFFFRNFDNKRNI